MKLKPLLLVAEENIRSSSDCDCACSESPFDLDISIDSDTKYETVSDSLIQKLSDDFWLIFSPFSPAGPSVINRQALDRYRIFENNPCSLTEPVDFDFARQNLIAPVGKSLIIQQVEIDTLVVWLHVTNACNLDCPYCYVRKSSERMSESVGKSVVEKIVQLARQNRFKRIKIKYAGGESTLHFDLVCKLHDYALQLLKNTTIELQEVVLSNGVAIKPKHANWLAQKNVKLMISLDGIGDVHDQLRPMKNGRKTFSYVENTIDNILKPLGILPQISVTVTKLNAQSLAETVEWILNRKLPFSINFYRENTQSENYSELQLEESRIIEGLSTAYKLIEENLPMTSLINGLLNKVVTSAHSHTCGVGQNYLVFTHTGSLSQCQMHLDSPVADYSIEASQLLPMIANGSIKSLSVDEKAGCQECPIRYRCTGGCPLETFRATGRWDLQSPNCNIYKTLYPKVLRLEGLRLIKKYQNQLKLN